MDCIESAWEQVDTILHSSHDGDKSIQKSTNGANTNVCSECASHNVIETKSEIVCGDCGLVISSFAVETSFSVVTPNGNSNGHNTSSKCRSQPKMTALKNNWYMFSNEEKNTFKLTGYVKELCVKLAIHDSVVGNTCETVVEVMAAIKKYEGTKRARVKDGIIISCIHYVLKDTNAYISTSELAKRIYLDVKYITRAEKMIIELMNAGKLKLNKANVLDIKQPFAYVQEVIKRNNMRIPKGILDRVALLIEVCDAHDLLLDHTPLSVGVSCFYYVLKRFDIPIDIKVFSELYDLSVVTITKTVNKLKAQNELLQKYF
jgi:transcription initiation factor TFIIIB Brf1 subunit/transcription initiation factor TFIIB